MQRPRRFEYALLAVIDLAAADPGERVQLREIAARQDVPEKYLEQLLRPLKATGLVVATRGSRGGYQLGRAPEEITVADVLEAIEGPLDGDQEPASSSLAAPVIDALWSDLNATIRERLAAVSLRELVERYRTRLAADDNWVI